MTVDRPLILVADGDSGVRNGLTETLKSDGYTVLAAESGERLLECAALEAADAFILDVDMPGIDGVELCRTLRQMDRYRATPIILVAGSVADTVLARAFGAGCDDFINKPLDARVLKVRLRGHVARMAYFQQLDRTRLTVNQYISRRTLEVAEIVARTGNLPPPEERELAILFTDIRGFTALSEEAVPAELFSVVSSILADQVNGIHEFGGYVDKFGGDGVMAIFDGTDMAIRSCLCALRILKGAQAQNLTRGDNVWRSGIGIHVGRAVIGNIGSPDHLDYSAIGNAVNLAARLCGHAEATSIAVSQAVRDIAMGDSRLRFHAERLVSMKGMKTPMTIYSLS